MSNDTAIVQHYNEGCDQPLFIRKGLECNTDDDTLRKQIKANSLRAIQYFHSGYAENNPLATLELHIVGSGPSSTKTAPYIDTRANVLFLNNAANTFYRSNPLQKHHSHMHLICDARAENVEFVTDKVDQLYLAAQVHPLLLDTAMSLGIPTELVHLLITDTPARYEALLPPVRPAYTLLTSTSTVGLQALYLAFAMGYRRIVLHGYDCSYDRQGRPRAAQQFHSPDVSTSMRFQGIDYVMNLAMRHQLTRLFPAIATLRAYGTTVEVRGSGIFPHMHNAIWSEQDKYDVAWQLGEYHLHSPGADLVDEFLRTAKPEGTVVDIGAGAGYASRKLRHVGLDVVQADFVAAGPSSEFPRQICDITETRPWSAVPDLSGFCCDVMEHIQPDRVQAALRNTLMPKGTYYSISLLPDEMGKLFGQPLHLTVQPAAWWLEQLAEAGGRVEWFEHDEAVLRAFVVPA